MNQASDRATPGMCVDDSGMRQAATDNPQKIIVVGDYNSIFGLGISKMFVVGGPDQSGVACGRDVNAAKAQAISHRAVDVFIEMKANFHQRS
ncbi:MAG: hypothetical protein L6306_01170 [Planctomycetales bacterium]|nr:hypothetical protein [Planctomycetales bacterium]